MVFGRKVTQSLPRKRTALSANQLTAIVSVLFALFYSAGFWKHLMAADLLPGLRGVLFLAAAGLLMVGMNILVLSLLAWRFVHKPLLAVVILLAASAAYFIDSYGVVVDRHALQSVLETDAREGAQWLSWKMLVYLGLLGVVPVLALWRVPVTYRPWPRELLSRGLMMLAALVLIGLAIAPFSREMASTARNHSQLRDLATPFNVFSAVRGYIKHSAPAAPVVIRPLGTDARGGTRPPGAKPRLLVLVIGESARAASFSLGGYGRDTNRELAKLDITYFTDVSSCGTNTATSLPCMFSNLGRKDYRESAAKSSENLLDVITHAGFQVEWEDNNTGSKRIALRSSDPEEDMATLGATDLCDEEGCLDELLVRHLRRELLPTDPDATGDKVYVLHMIGSHGPAYFKRYPKAFERFTPSCDSVALQSCTPEQIRNSYDNTIAYTDHILARLVALLGEHADQRTSALLYLSDHGESTGESGVYLHGAPYLFAPGEQTKVPMLLWSSPAFREWRGLDMACAQARRTLPVSHDHFFHTVLGLLDVQTSAYRSELDALAGCAPA
ncbi:MAG: phosphoethanolamine--lipid A transferase [Arenimonas sp.]|uniref:phosphoethanolamine transferase n=1 Tax=Arenimonas sp. TaxID=1872635 RepID=UPI0025C6F749|nr:phosphoethanolamine--lipid A transferase [Arenimonas sp.]MBW8367398.1 phosphoethanolamine--lipid A transferase [Arenimonas sp.]